MKTKSLILFAFSATFALDAFADPLSPASVLREAFAKNPELAAKEAMADGERSAVRGKYWLGDPKVGIMREANLTSDQRAMGAMQTWSVSQEIMFPTKYLSQGARQSAQADAAQEDFLDTKLSVRQKALSLYYRYYAASRIADLLEAKRETLREISRIVETRRATGAVPQQDEIKAHLEQTKIENEVLLQNQEVVDMQAMLRAVLNRDPDEDLALPSKELRAPKIHGISALKESAYGNSKKLAAEQARFSAAESARTLAKMSYLPDFKLTYRKPYGTHARSNAFAFGVEMSVPLWFLTKQTSEVSAASAKALAAEYRLEATKRNVEADVKGLGNKVETLAKLLKIYETALIPQSTSALNSSRSAYRAGRVGFQELLDAERSLYSVRIEYYRNLANFVDSLTNLERIAGMSVSDLPMDGAE